MGRKIHSSDAYQRSTNKEKTHNNRFII